MREVVGVALLHGGRVLAARRSAPAALAGLWEFPGGKVEPGEDAGKAAVREVSEELGCTIEVFGWLDGSAVVPVDAAAGEELVLRVALAHLVDGDPVPTEHDAVRWLGPHQLDEVRWVGPDVPFLGPVRDELEAG